MEPANATDEQTTGKSVAPGEDVPFPLDGAVSESGISRTGDCTFQLADAGVYQVLFVVSVSEVGQLVLTLNDQELAYTVVGRESALSQIFGMALVTVTDADSILTVRNPAEEQNALTLTPRSGGSQPVSAHLIIKRLQ